LTLCCIDISTTYVEHLRSKPSAPPTPSTTPLSSRAATPKPCPRTIYFGRSPSRTRPPSIQKHVATVSERTPLLLAADGVAVTDSSTTAYIPTELTSSTQAIGLPNTQPNPHIPAHLQSHHAHHMHHKHPVVDFIKVLTNSPRICRLGLGPAGEHQHHHHQHDHDTDDDGRSTGRLSRRHSAVRIINEEHEDGEYNGLRDQTNIHGAPTIGRKRQVVSILVSFFSPQHQLFDLIAIPRSSN